MNKYNLNQQQWLVLAGFILTFVSGVFVSKGLLTETQASDLVNQIMGAIPIITQAIGILIPIVTAIIGIAKQSHASQVTAASELPGVQKIVVDPKTATPGVLSVANDSSVPKVEVAKNG